MNDRCWNSRSRVEESHHQLIDSASSVRRHVDFANISYLKLLVKPNQGYSNKTPDCAELSADKFNFSFVRVRKVLFFYFQKLLSLTFRWNMHEQSDSKPVLSHRHASAKHSSWSSLNGWKLTDASAHSPAAGFQSRSEGGACSRPDCATTGRAPSYWLRPQVSFRTCHEI